MITFEPKAKWRRIQHPLGGDWFAWGEVAVCVTREGGEWHLSISHPRRYPTWTEIRQAWYDLVPGAGVDFEGAIILPRNCEYVNLHPNCFHVYQLRDAETPKIISSSNT